MAMDRVQLVLLGLPLLLLCTDLLNLFTPPPPKASHDHRHHHHHHHQQQQQQQQQQQAVIPETPDFPSKSGVVGGVGLGNSVNINFCSSCSYRGTAVTMKNMLENAFPGIDVALANYPPSMPKRLLSKAVPVLQIGVIGIVVAGEQIFPMLGFIAPPPWYYSLRANKFGTIASVWLLGNSLQSFLQSSGAFEVYFNGELVFSKLKENRFPGEIELKDFIGRKMATSRLANDIPNLWSHSTV
ncbi:SelT-like protein [Quillaja saponaria]|uniref:SelT-like protein n=1 Tax=Quillaja saponaria TaxID=32244 RepID=A0AAD7PL63_QUISA|nr:SelT-like protein [Quillaja saponaria]